MSGRTGGWEVEGGSCWEAFGARLAEIVCEEAVGVEVTGTFAGLETPRSCVKMRYTGSMVPSYYSECNS